MAIVARNSFKGYTYQQYIYLLFTAIMDSEREIQTIDAETIIDHNFDDLYVKKDIEYMIQVKNYPNTTMDDVKVYDNKIVIKGKASIYNEKYSNIIIINTDKIETNTKILNLNAYKEGNIFIVPLSTDKIEDLIENLFSSELRLNKIIHFAYERCISSNYHLDKSELPEYIRFSTDLDKETVLLRSPLESIDKGILCMVGKPGVGKSHYVRELQEKYTNAILYRFCVGSQDLHQHNRLSFGEFINDIALAIFKSPRSFTYQELVTKINEDEPTIIIDGLDHIENYNPSELNKYIKFVDDIGNAHILVLTRPLCRKIEWKQHELENWNQYETIEYLAQAYSICDYRIANEIYKIANGYPIITYYLAAHYNLTGKINIEKEVTEINEYYDLLMTNVKTKEAIGFFLLNDSYFLKEEISDLCEDELLAKIIINFIDDYPYLFKIQINRVSLIHDSLNTYLKKNSINYIQFEKKIILKIEHNIRNKEIKYMSRIGSFNLNENFINEILLEYSDINVFKHLVRSNFDYDSIREFYRQLKVFLEMRLNVLDIYQYYSFVLISLIVERNDLIGNYELLYQYLKYAKSHSISEEFIFSSGVIWGIFQLLSFNNEFPYNRILNDLHYSTDEIDRAMEAFESEAKFFNILTETVDEEKTFIELSKNNHMEMDKENIIVHLFVKIMVNEKKVSKYYNLVKLYLADEKDKTVDQEIKALCRRFGVREFFANSIMKRVRYQLWELGYVRKGNIFLEKNINELIEYIAPEGSFEVCSWVTSYLRLANREGREVDINTIGKVCNMYYNHKDYSVINMNDALRIFENKGLVNENTSVELLICSMKQSDKGIRHILQEYINDKDEAFIDRLLKEGRFYGNFPVDIFDLTASRIDHFPENLIVERMRDLLYYHRYGRKVEYSDIQNVLNSKYSHYIIETLKNYGYGVYGVPDDVIPILNEIETIPKLKTEEKEYKPFEGGYIHEEDEKYILQNNISYMDIAKFTDGWYSCLPYINLYANYKMDDLRKDITKIIHTSLFARIPDIKYIGNWWLCLGNILEFLYMIDADVNWDKLFKNFTEFLNISLITTKSSDLGNR
jgi:hypothetical protein